LFGNYDVTPKGKTYFSFDMGSLQIKEPMSRRVIEVTGIADGPGMLGPPGTIKDVQFTWKWNWDAVPKEVKQFLGPEPNPAKGEALLKLYDDGWRVEELKQD
jgi:hypothetical protein